MRLRGTTGYATLTDPLGGGVLKETDTFTCAHCNVIVHVKARCALEDLGGRCTVCDDLICPRCVARGSCDPLEKKLARMEARKAYV